MNIFTKQPSERIPISMDFTNLLTTDETILTLTVTAMDSDDEDVTSAVVYNSSISDNVCRATIQAGIDSERYKITFSVTSSLSAIYEEDVFMKVYEI